MCFKNQLENSVQCFVMQYNALLLQSTRLSLGERSEIKSSSLECKNHTVNVNQEQVRI